MGNLLRGSPIGSLIPITGFDSRFNEPYEVNAYLPAPLPAEVQLNRSTWLALTEATRALGQLDTAAGLIPNPQLLTRVATRLEAVGTSALEGTYAKLADVFAAEVVPENEQALGIPPNVREVMNYLRAADLAYGWVDDGRPITLGMLSDLQAEIVRDTDSDGPEAGAVRVTQVFIGAKHRRVSEARFVPPPPGDHLVAGCQAWLQWLSDPQVLKEIPLIARIAMAHYQFETLHPYTDGNGRIGRLVAVLQMLSEKELCAPVLSVSTWLTDRADEYRDHLLNVSRTGDWCPWIEFFAHAVAAEATSGRHRIMRLLSLRDELVEKVSEAMPRARLALEIAGDLIAFPFLTVAQAERRHGRTNQANRNAIKELVELGILEQYGGNRYGQLFWSPRVFHVIES